MPLLGDQLLPSFGGGAGDGIRRARASINAVSMMTAQARSVANASATIAAASAVAAAADDPTLIHARSAINAVSSVAAAGRTVVKAASAINAVSAMTAAGGVLSGLSALILATQPASLIGYWPCDDASGGARDASGNGRHLTIVDGAPQFQQAGFNGPCINFDNSVVDSRIREEVTAPATIFGQTWGGSTPMTMMAMIRPNSLVADSWMGGLGWKNNTTNANIFPIKMGLTTNTQFRVRLINSASTIFTGADNLGTAIWTDDAWTILFMRWSPATGSNGQLILRHQAKTDFTANAPPGFSAANIASDGFYIGGIRVRSNASLYFSAAWQHVAIWNNQLLTDTEIDDIIDEAGF